QPYPCQSINPVLTLAVSIQRQANPNSHLHRLTGPFFLNKRQLLYYLGKSRRHAFYPLPSLILFCKNHWTFLCNNDGMLILGRAPFIHGTGSPVICIHLTFPIAFINHWLNRNNHTFLYAKSFIRQTEMRDMRFVLKRWPDGMSCKIPYDREAFPFCICLNCVADITDPLTCSGLFNTFV